MDTLTLADLRHRNITIEPHEAVAIAQKLMHDCSSNAAARPPFGPPSLETVAISADGAVHCIGSDTTPSVPEVAIVLQDLMTLVERRVPGGLRYAIGRALLEVEAPPFDSVTEFSDALERFEQTDRTAALAGLFARAVAAPPELGAEQGACEHDRRRRTPSATEIRRQLRDADLRLYQIQQLAQGPLQPASSRGKRTMRGPVAACMLAGLALVAVGEATRGLPLHRSAASPTDASTRAGGSTDPAMASDIALPSGEVATVAAAAAPEVNSAPPPAPQPRRPAVSSRRLQPRAGSTQEIGNRARPALTAHSKSSRRQADDRGLLRIRFEWNNPFK